MKNKKYKKLTSGNMRGWEEMTPSLKKKIIFWALGEELVMQEKIYLNKRVVTCKVRTSKKV